MKDEIDKIFGNVNTEPLDLSAFDKDSMDGLEAKRIAKNRLNETTKGTAKVIVDILPKGKCIPNTKYPHVSNGVKVVFVVIFSLSILTFSHFFKLIIFCVVYELKSAL